MAGAPFVALSNIDRRPYFYKPGDQFPDPADKVSEPDLHRLVTKNAIAKTATVSKEALESADYLARLKRDMDADRKQRQRELRESALEEERQDKGAKLTVKEK